MSDEGKNTAPDMDQDTQEPKETKASKPKPPKVGSEEWLREKVPIRLFKDSDKYKDDVFVGVNGRGYLIRRGVEVMVPRFVAEIVMNGMEQDTKAAELSESLQADFAAQSANLGI